MSTTPPNAPVSLQSGAYIIGRAVGPFIIKNVPGKNGGQGSSFIEGKVLAGQEFVQITRRLEPGETPWLPEHDEIVHALIKPNWKTNGVIVVEAKLQRPVVAK